MSRSAERYPAQVIRDDAGRLAVRLLSPAEDVLPQGVRLLGQPRERILKALEFKFLETTAFDALQSLRGLEILADDESAAAEALALHCQNHPSRSLLCSEHGLPVGHLLGNGPWQGCPAGHELRVDHVLAMVRSLTAVEGMAFHATHRRTSLKKVQLDDVMQWRILDPDLGWDRGKQFTLLQQQALIKEYLSALQWQSGTAFVYEWLEQLGLRLTFSTAPWAANRVRTDLGIYVAAFLDVVLDVVNVSGVQRSVRCDSCGQSFQPRNSRQRFCRRPDCQREHRRINKARVRARHAASEGESQ